MIELPWTTTRRTSSPSPSSSSSPLLILLFSALLVLLEISSDHIAVQATTPPSPAVASTTLSSSSEPSSSSSSSKSLLTFRAMHDRILQQGENEDCSSTAGAFIAALDQSGGSTPKALASYGMSPENGNYEIGTERYVRYAKPRNATQHKILLLAAVGSRNYEFVTLSRPTGGLPWFVRSFAMRTAKGTYCY